MLSILLSVVLPTFLFSSNHVCAQGPPSPSATFFNEQVGVVCLADPEKSFEIEYALYKSNFNTEEAIDFCEDLGPEAMLLQIDTDTQFNFVASFVRRELLSDEDEVTVPLGMKADVSLSGTQAGNTDRFTFLNSEVSNASYYSVENENPWLDGQPNDQGGSEDCVLFFIKQAGTESRWNDVGCSRRGSFICMKLGCLTTPTTGPTLNPTFPEPTPIPSGSPINMPTVAPTNFPTETPTVLPTLAPSIAPTNLTENNYYEEPVTEPFLFRLTIFEFSIVSGIIFLMLLVCVGWFIAESKSLTGMRRNLKELEEETAAINNSGATEEEDDYLDIAPPVPPRVPIKALTQLAHQMKAKMTTVGSLIGNKNGSTLSVEVGDPSFIQKDSPIPMAPEIAEEGIDAYLNIGEDQDTSFDVTLRPQNTDATAGVSSGGRFGIVPGKPNLSMQVDDLLGLDLTESKRVLMRINLTQQKTNEQDAETTVAEVGETAGLKQSQGVDYNGGHESTELGGTVLTTNPEDVEEQGEPEEVFATVEVPIREENDGTKKNSEAMKKDI